MYVDEFCDQGIICGYMLSTMKYDLAPSYVIRFWRNLLGFELDVFSLEFILDENIDESLLLKGDGWMRLGGNYRTRLELK